MRKRTRNKRGHCRVTYGDGPPEVGGRGEDAPRKEQRGHTYSESPLAVRGRWVLSCHLSATAEKSCSGFLGLRRESSGENWGFVAFGVFVF